MREARRTTQAAIPAAVRWSARNTFDASQFGDRHALLALKRAQGLTISLGLPALNEAATIGRHIEVLRRALVDEVPLLDEIVVIDGGSEDGTAALARRLGVPTYGHAEILPEYGAYRGKGEALWKSLHALQGDLIAWIDTDIQNIHPKFVYGLLGPLLHYPSLAYVKGYYRRPITVGGRYHDSGGGRVTELTARPLLNLLFPDLAGVLQPLAGEYAGRREVLEQLPFFTGYGVEVGLLIDVLRRQGLDRIAQVDLHARIHRNRDLSSLSEIALAVVQAVMIRAGVPLAGKIYPAGTIPRLEHERPPIATIPEYRRRHRRCAALAAGAAREG